MSSKWSEGIEPRGFRWIITERLGVCERPGGYGAGHRRVRRHEEIIWLRRNEIGLIISLTAIPYNLRDYHEQGLAYVPLPLSGAGDSRRLGEILRTVHEHVASERVVLHHDSIGDRLSGVVAGYLLWSGLVDSGPEAVTIAEQLLERELGPTARELVAMAGELRSSQ